MSVVKNTFFNFFGRLIPLLVALGTVPLLLRLVGEEKFGVLAVIWALLNYFAFFDLGLGRAVSQRMAKLSIESDLERSNLLWSAILTIIVLGSIGSGLVWLIADALVSNYLDVSMGLRVDASNAVKWLFLALPTLLLSAVFQGALQGRLCFAELNIAQVFGGVLSQLLPLLSALMGYVDIDSLVLATVIGRIFTLLYLVKKSIDKVPLLGAPVMVIHHLKHFINYGGWVSILSILGPLLVTVDRFVIGALLGAKWVAAYTVPYDLVSRVMMIPGSLSSAIFPKLASESMEDAKARAVHNTSILMAIMTPMAVVGVFLVQPFMILWIDADFATSALGVGEFIFLGVWLNAVVVPHAARLLANENPRNIVYIYLLEIPVYFLLLYLGVKLLGVMGAALAWSLRVALDTALLLKLANELKSTFWSMLPSLILVSSSIAVTITEPRLPIDRWVLLPFFIALSLILERKSLLEMYCYVKSNVDWLSHVRRF